MKVDVTFEVTVSIDPKSETLLIPEAELFERLSDEEVEQAVEAAIRRVVEYGISPEDISDVAFYDEQEGVNP
jgi:hypothetical protein